MTQKRVLMIYKTCSLTRSVSNVNCIWSLGIPINSPLRFVAPLLAYHGISDGLFIESGVALFIAYSR